MKDRALRNALKQGDLIFSREYPDIGMQDDAAARSRDRKQLRELSGKLGALFGHLGLEYVEYEKPFIRNIKP